MAKVPGLKNFMPLESSERQLCTKCLQPAFSCYCRLIRRFDPNIEFVILMHPLEMRRRIATGRMSYLCLEGSHLVVGTDYTHDQTLEVLLADSRFNHFILFPRDDALNLSELPRAELHGFFPSQQRLRIYVVDGTWTTAKKTLNRNSQLANLPALTLTLPKPSTFRVRRQPHAKCWSTLEAIYGIIEALGPVRSLDPLKRPHDNLLEVFNYLVEQQLGFIEKARAQNIDGSRYHLKRKDKIRV